MQTADEMLAIARKGRPNVRYARNKKGTRIAAWHDGRWVAVAGLLLDGNWASIRFEILVDGKTITPQGEWIE